MSDFKEAVVNFIKKVPEGRVVSYGQVAAACGHPRAARQVGVILKTADVKKEKIPWWRVVNNQGVISIKGNWTATKELQKALLIKDGVKVRSDYTLDIDKYQWLH